MSGAAVAEGAGAVVGGVGGFFAGGPVGAIAGAGAGMSMVGQIVSAKSQSEIDAEKQALENAQADQIATREAANEALRNDASFKSQLDFSSQAAASGHAGGGIASQLEIRRQTELQNSISSQEAQFQESQLRAGASMLGQLSSDTSTAGYLNATSTLLGATGKIYNISAPNTAPTQSLPSIPRGY